MPLQLDPIEVRVLGSLLEKAVTTPEYYPLTLNALANACNQKSNRDPVVSYDEETVAGALDRLREKGLSFELTGGGNRVPKYGHRITEAMNLGRREEGLLCVLMLRGPQTAGELRERSARMYAFSDLGEIESVLRRLIERELVVLLPRQPGYKEPRYAHLLSGPVEVTAGRPEAAAASRQDRIGALEAEVAQLRQAVERLQQQFADFRKQFD